MALCLAGVCLLRGSRAKELFLEGVPRRGDNPPLDCDKLSEDIVVISSTPKKFADERSVSENHEDFSSVLRTLKSLTAVTAKLEWLRSQLIGGQLEFMTPFGKRQLLYVDQTASGRGLLFIENFITRNVLPFYGNTHTEDSYVGQRISRMVGKSSRYIKRRLGGTDQDALIFCGSGTTAALKRLQEVMGIAVPSTLRSRVLGTLKQEERWVVFTGPYEHHSNLLSWRQSLAEVVEIPTDNEGLIDLTALKSALESPMYRSRQLKLGSFSACSNVSGIMTDTRAIARLLHDHGAFACFDFAASAPHVQIDMRSSEEDGYDAIVLSPHKFIGGPGTPGILLMRKTLYTLGKNPPSTCGGGTVAYVNGFTEKDTLYHDDIEEREDAGTPPIVQKIKCAVVLRVKELMGDELIQQREERFIEKAIKRLSLNPNIRILGNTTAKRASILSFVVMTTEPEAANNGSYGAENGNERARRASRGVGKPLHGRFVVTLLNDLFGIQARGGCACAGPYGHTLLDVGQELSLEIREAIEKGYGGLKPGWARLSFCYDMTDEEVEYILAAIEVVAQYGQRFLALYAFDWGTGNWNIAVPPPNRLSTSREVDTFDGHKHDLSAKVEKFRHCLGIAEAIAQELPAFPPRRPIPAKIPVDLVLFCI